MAKIRNALKKRYHRVNQNIKQNDLNNSRNEFYYLIIMMLIVVSIVGFELKLLSSELVVKKILAEEINYDSYRRYQISSETLVAAETKADHLIKKNSELHMIPFINDIGYLTLSMMATSYQLDSEGLVDEDTFLRGIGRLAEKEEFQELYCYNRAIISDLEYFPVPDMKEEGADVSYSDSWYKPRTYGGDRKHEGTDIMASNNVRGFFPVLSITDGVVEKMGWLEQGGNRIGIRSACGGYFYYAHLSSYAPELEPGDNVIAGQLLGFMGDSGYGSEGTIGQFAVHLHLGIYVNSPEGEMSVNPYWILKYLERNRISYHIHEKADACKKPTYINSDPVK